MSHKWGEGQFRELANYRTTKWANPDDDLTKIEDYKHWLFQLVMNRAADSLRASKTDVATAHLDIEFRRPGASVRMIIDPPRVERSSGDTSDTKGSADKLERTELACAP